eukprot:1160167-Pelagomonas_calceolata.AAC.3
MAPFPQLMKGVFHCLGSFFCPVFHPPGGTVDPLVPGALNCPTSVQLLRSHRNRDSELPASRWRPARDLGAGLMPAPAPFSAERPTASWP